MKKTAFLMVMCWMGIINFHSHAQDLTGSWHNQLGSTLTVIEADTLTGFIRGHYVSPVGTSGKEYPLVGWINSKPREDGKHQVRVITFCVRWGEYGSVASWTGYYDVVGGTPKITTMWHLSRPLSGSIYDHILVGCDVFIPASR